MTPDRPSQPKSVAATQASAHDSGGVGSEDPNPTTARLIAAAHRISAARQRRKHFLDSSLFAELGWEMLLALFIADASFYRMTVSNLSAASNGPESTALRWIDKLIELKLVRRRSHPLDARVTFIELETKGREALTAYITEVACGGIE